MMASCHRRAASAEPAEPADLWRSLVLDEYTVNQEKILGPSGTCRAGGQLFYAAGSGFIQSPENTLGRTERMPQLLEAFRNLAEARLSEDRVAHEWHALESKTLLVLPAASIGGFEVRVECETYGLYVYAEGWHGAPFEIGPLTPTPVETAANCLGFVRTLLSQDSLLRVTYAGSKPVRWRLSYATDTGTEQEEVGLLLFNFLAPRTQRTLVNKQLPARYAPSAA